MKANWNFLMAEKITEEIMKICGDEGDRLAVMKKSGGKERELGGYCRSALISAITNVLDRYQS